jgi:phage shock protein B
MASQFGMTKSEEFFIVGILGWLGLLAFLFISIVTIGLAVAIVKRAMRGGRPKKEQEVEAEDTRLIQEIHNGLQRMEDRIDALETIIMDRSGSRTPGLDRELR